MNATRIFETVLHARDLAAAEQFYRDVLGLEAIQRSDLLLALRCGSGVLLVFDPDKSSVPGREVPSHGAHGSGHVAFAMRDDEFDAWKQHLLDCGVAIEQEVHWEQGGRSIYFRDPAGNSIELAPPTLWGGGWSF